MKRRALVVDDNATIRVLSRRVLELLDFEVDEAEDGEIALEKAKAASYRMVLTDINMPRRDGLSLIEELRKLDAYRRVPILVVSTDGRPETLARGRTVGANGWLCKPFQREQLIDLLTALAGRSRSPDQ